MLHSYVHRRIYKFLLNKGHKAKVSFYRFLVFWTWASDKFPLKNVKFIENVKNDTLNLNADWPQQPTCAGEHHCNDIIGSHEDV